MSKKFKIGDIVKCIYPYDGNHDVVGKYGVVICVPDDDEYDGGYEEYGVQFFDNIRGHNCGYLGKDGHCWNIIGKYLVLNNSDIDILIKKIDNFLEIYG